MVLKTFRITHSTLIEHYQFIESHLEAIYAAVSDGPFWNVLEEIEKDSLGGVIRELEYIDTEKGLNLFTFEEYAALRSLTTRRNYWCHFCYCDMAFNLKTGAPAEMEDVENMLEDMKIAQTWRDRLFRTKTALLEQLQTV